MTGGLLPLNPAARKRELEHRERVRVEAYDAAMIKLNKGVAQATPAFTDQDVAEVGRLIVEGKVRLPRHATFTVETEIEERKDPASNTTSTIHNHTFDQLLCNRLQPMSIRAALEAGLLVRLGSNWLCAKAPIDA
jgi:hypothetical protein